MSWWTHAPHDLLVFRQGDKVAAIDTDATPGFSGTKSDAPDVLAERSSRLAELQEMLYANYKASDDTRSVLLVLQGMDTAGKGGIVKHVVGSVNPMGVRYTAFGKPTEEELSHHFLWRIRRALPPAGHIGVFDRSHYEDVLVVRVQALVPEERWRRRYDHIVAFEQMLADEGTTIVKLFLHISKDEQRERLQKRLDDPSKHWKFDPADLENRRRWDDYQQAFTEAIERTTADHAPWYVIPADRKWFRNLAVSEILVQTLDQLCIEVPPSPDLDGIVVD